MEWGNHLFMLAALALCVLPLIKSLANDLHAGISSSDLKPRDIWAKPKPAWVWYAKLLLLIVLVAGLGMAWVLFMIETFSTSDL